MNKFRESYAETSINVFAVDVTAGKDPPVTRVGCAHM
jgi:hypothetical protein